jgi:hypothetical protein
MVTKPHISVTICVGFWRSQSLTKWELTLVDSLKHCKRNLIGNSLIHCHFIIQINLSVFPKFLWDYFSHYPNRWFNSSSISFHLTDLQTNRRLSNPGGKYDKYPDWTVLIIRVSLLLNCLEWMSPARWRGVGLYWWAAELITKQMIDRDPEPRRCDGASLYATPPRQGYNRARSRLNTRWS